MNYTGQNCEDEELERFFGPTRRGFYVEVGALDGIEFSNTYRFETALGWSGILIEPNPSAAAECEANRPNSVTVRCAAVEPHMAFRPMTFNIVEDYPALSSRRLTWWSRRIISRISRDQRSPARVSTIEVETATLDHILTRANCPPRFEFMTIDIEGFELAALRGMALGTHWKPRVLLIENGTGIVGIGLALYLIRSRYGYKRSIGVNDWYQPATFRDCIVGIVRAELRGGIFFARQRVNDLRRISPLFDQYYGIFRKKGA